MGGGGHSAPLSLSYCPFEWNGRRDEEWSDAQSRQVWGLVQEVFTGAAVTVGEGSGSASVAGEGGRPW